MTTAVDDGAVPASIACDFMKMGANGTCDPLTRHVAVERAIALEFNGFGYAVMMASPTDIEDFVVGFALSERLISYPAEILSIDRHATDQGDVVRINLAPHCAALVFERTRHRVSDASCGLCGIENLEQAMRPLPTLAFSDAPAPDAIFRALKGLRDTQPVNRSTGAVHAAALCRADGTIAEVREDVGRHNAFDKLIGAMHRGGQSWEDGFALLSSRCSFELVEKAALSGCPTLVTISAATDLAIARAKSCGLHLIVLARPDAVLEVA